MLEVITQLMMSNWSSLLSWLPVLIGCIAIWKPKGVHIAKKYLENCYDNNPQGAGFAICKDNKIEIQKGFFKFKDFWKAFKDLQKYPALVHFRIATHGAVNKENCHPFTMGDKFAMIHNGILPFPPPKGKDESDSAHFAKKILGNYIGKVPWEDEGFTKLVNESINSGNKVIVMRNDGKAWIFNEKQGDWFKGAWYSNTGYKYSSRRTYKKYTGAWNHGYGWCGTSDDDQYWSNLTSEKLSKEDQMELAKIEGDNEWSPSGVREEEVNKWLAQKKLDATTIEPSSGITDVEFDAKTNTWSKKSKLSSKPYESANPRYEKAVRKLSKETYKELHEREAKRIKDAATRLIGTTIASAPCI